mmetsp:Transcript_65852/g.157381  ORF Transcript_65852/g.157381 Transcript_65852/m.157381 type:complete len:381 (+) Transcript_65852:82-1224(+)
MEEVSGPYVGIIKSFNDQKGWGHIACDATFQAYNKDVFLLRSQLIGVQSVTKNSQVSFSVIDNGRGPEAASVQVLYEAPPDGSAFAPSSTTMQAAPAMNIVGATFVGTIKSFNPSSGWGHITCAETERLFGKDVFFMKSQVPGGNILKGTEVTFNVAQGQKGPEAQNIRPTQGQVQANGGHHMMPTMAAMPTMSMPAVPTMAAANLVSKQAPINNAYVGAIKSYNEEKGWGHIECPQTHLLYGKDIFVLRSALGGNIVRPSDKVVFNVTMGMKGPEACNVKLVSHSQTDVFAGTIKMWNEEKGWGFIECDETRQIYGKDIFLHKNELFGNNPVLGEAVQFSVRFSDQGRPEATSVQFASTMHGAYVAMRPQAATGRAAPY